MNNAITGYNHSSRPRRTRKQCSQNRYLDRPVAISGLLLGIGAYLVLTPADPEGLCETVIRIQKKGCAEEDYDVDLLMLVDMFLQAREGLGLTPAELLTLK